MVTIYLFLVTLETLDGGEVYENIVFFYSGNADY